MIAKDISFFFLTKTSKELFEAAHLQLPAVCDWSIANKLYLNDNKRQYVLLHKQHYTDAETSNFSY